MQTLRIGYHNGTTLTNNTLKTHLSFLLKIFVS